MVAPTVSVFLEQVASSCLNCGQSTISGSVYVKHISIVISVSVLVLTGCESTNTSSSPTTTTTTNSPSDLVDLVGAGAGQAELGLNNKGYELARTEGLTAYWWNETSQTCARIVTNEGSYESIDTASSGDCEK